MTDQRGTAVKRILAALTDHGSRVEQHGADTWAAQCPADGHDDRTASLAVAQGDAGAVVWCHAGCDTKTAVLPPLKLGFPDLFDQPRKARVRAPRRVAAEYRYTDEHGDLLFVKVRFEPKGFSVKHPDGHGGWVQNIGTAPRVLYRLPEVIAAINAGKTVFLVEGEKDADRLASLGYVATCNHDGAAKEDQRTKWRPQYGDALKGADVVIIADRDGGGYAHARAAYADLQHKAKSVILRQAAVDKPKADVSDHLNAGYTLDRLQPLLVAAASVTEPSDEEEASEQQPVWDPDKPLLLLEQAAAMKPGTERDQQAVAAVRSMFAVGADAGVMAVARNYAKREKLLSNGDFESIRREAAQASSDAGERAPSVATQLVEIAQELYAFGVSDLGEPFAIPREGPKVVAMLRDSKTSLRALLSREYFTRAGKVPAQQALADALLVVEGFAQEQEPSRLYMRSAEHGGALWLDLGDQSGRAVRITVRGWSIEDEVPVLFKRTALTAALPEPARGGKIGDLWKWLNVSEDDRPLIAAELVARLFSDVPHVVLAILGEHGTAKTTTTKILVFLLDPSPVPVRKPPRDMESWVTMAAGSWVVALDNLSDIPSWLSDSICRASTGDGDVRRRLFTDGDYAVFAFRRCVIFNGIDVGALASDLADRTLPITLQLIPEGDRKSEKTFWADWESAHPKLLGAVLDLAVKVLLKFPDIALEKTPRMADYALVLAAVDATLGTKALARYANQGKNLAAESLSDDPLAAEIAKRVTKPFEDTAAKLLKLVTPPGEWQPPKDWPKNARQVTGRLTRLAPAFRQLGWDVQNLGSENHDNVLHWHISPPAQPEKSREEARQPSQGSQGARDARVGEPENEPSQVDGHEENRVALALIRDTLGGEVAGTEDHSAA